MFQRQEMWFPRRCLAYTVPLADDPERTISQSARALCRPPCRSTPMHRCRGRNLDCGRGVREVPVVPRCADVDRDGVRSVASVALPSKLLVSLRYDDTDDGTSPLPDAAASVSVAVAGSVGAAVSVSASGYVIRSVTTRAPGLPVGTTRIVSCIYCADARDEPTSVKIVCLSHRYRIAFRPTRHATMLVMRK